MQRWYRREATSDRLVFERPFQASLHWIVWLGLAGVLLLLVLGAMINEATYEEHLTCERFDSRAKLDRCTWDRRSLLFSSEPSIPIRDIRGVRLEEETETPTLFLLHEPSSTGVPLHHPGAEPEAIRRRIEQVLESDGPAEATVRQTYEFGFAGLGWYGLLAGLVFGLGWLPATGIERTRLRFDRTSGEVELHRSGLFGSETIELPLESIQDVEIERDWFMLHGDCRCSLVIEEGRTVELDRGFTYQTSLESRYREMRAEIHEFLGLD